MLTIAESLKLEDLRVKMVDGCAKKITLTELDRQRKLEENSKLTDSTYQQVIRFVKVFQLRENSQQLTTVDILCHPKPLTALIA